MIELVKIALPRKGASKEEVWYWQSDAAQLSFIIPLNSLQYITLLEFSFPKELTELVPDEHHFSGYNLKIKDEVLDYNRIRTINVKKYLYMWPRNLKPSAYEQLTAYELYQLKKILTKGWIELVSIWMNDSIPELVHYLPEWENYLTESLKAFPFLCNELKRKGLIETVYNYKYNTADFHSWLNIAWCCIEILLKTCPAIMAILQIDRGRTYPLLWAGYLWKKYHCLQNWSKVPKK